ncbi:MAG: CoA transferase, partial [Candidatus Dormibacteria bacterium]
VTRIEPPGGDPARDMPPMAGGCGAAFVAYNRGKRAIEIDYRDPAGREDLAELVAETDVFLHNWPPGRAEELGLAPEDVRWRNPTLIWAHASGWGGSPPEGGSILATDFLVQAHAGCAFGATPIGEAPAPTRITAVDAIAGLVAAEAVLAALLHRESSARGCTIRTSLLSGARRLQARILDPLRAGVESGRLQGRSVWEPVDLPMETADGYLMLGASAMAAARVLGIPGADDAAVAARLREHATAEWERLLADAGVPFARVTEDLGSLPADRRVSGLLEPADGACWAPSPPWHFA